MRASSTQATVVSSGATAVCTPLFNNNYYYVSSTQAWEGAAGRGDDTEDSLNFTLSAPGGHEEVVEGAGSASGARAGSRVAPATLGGQNSPKHRFECRYTGAGEVQPGHMAAVEMEEHGIGEGRALEGVACCGRPTPPEHLPLYVLQANKCTDYSAFQHSDDDCRCVMLLWSTHSIVRRAGWLCHTLTARSRDVYAQFRAHTAETYHPKLFALTNRIRFIGSLQTRERDRKRVSAQEYSIQVHSSTLPWASQILFPRCLLLQ